MAPTRLTTWLLNIGHALDHMFLLIFAAGVSRIAADFGFARWEDLMPYGAGAFLMFGLGSVPAGRLGDLWGRRAMMLVFYFGMALSCLLAALTQNAWQLAGALILLGTFSAIYHPVGIPMLVAGARRPGATLGISGLAGNLGIALAALVSGYLIEIGGWRLAFAVPGGVALLLGAWFAWAVPAETEAPARRKPTMPEVPRSILMRVFFVITATAITGSLLFNFTTNGNGELLRERFAGIVEDPSQLGILLALVYTVGACSQVIVGRMIDRFPIRRLYLGVLLLQAPAFLLAAQASGWWFLLMATAYMVSVFAAIPFTDALIVRFVDDRMRSRVSGMRLAVSFGVSSLAVWMLGPVVKAAGFNSLLLSMAAIAALTWLFAFQLPRADLSGAGNLAQV
ncbi:MAG: MFS transporter [Burkholderiaceae bacterium]